MSNTEEKPLAVIIKNDNKLTVMVRFPENTPQEQVKETLEKAHEECRNQGIQLQLVQKQEDVSMEQFLAQCEEHAKQTFKQ